MTSLTGTGARPSLALGAYSSSFSFQAMALSASTSSTAISVGSGGNSLSFQSSSASLSAVSFSFSAEAQGMFGSLPGGGRGVPAERAPDPKLDAAKGAADKLRAILDDPMKAVMKAIDALTDDFGDMFKGMGFDDGTAGNLAKKVGPMMKLKALTGGPEALGLEFQAMQSVTAIEFRQVEVSFRQGPEGTSLSVNMQSISFRSETTVIGMRLKGPPETDPLILDLDGNGVETSPFAKLFDIDANGKKDVTGWVAGKDALLALDRNGNGSIDDGGELFGDQHGAENGFIELAKFDGNADGGIDAKDWVFGKLHLLSADGGLRTLEEAGVARIRLDAVVPVDEAIAGGTAIARSSFDFANGRTGRVDDVRFAARLDVVA